MTANNQNEEFEEVLNLYWSTKMKDVHTAFPCRIVKYEPDKGIATIKPLIKVKFKNETTDTELPEIQDVPVLLPRTATTLDFYPIANGDIGLAVCSERSISDWVAGEGDANFPKDGRKFDLSDAYFIPGGYPVGKPFGKDIPSGATGKILKNGAKLFFGSTEPVAATTAKKELVSLIREMADWMKLMNAAHAGAGTIPVATVTAGIDNLIAALQEFEVT